KSSSRLEARSVPWLDRPVMLPPGRARLDKAGGNRVPHDRKDNRDNRCRLLCKDGCWGSVRQNNIDLEPDELGRDFGEALGSSFRPTIFDRNVATLDPTEFAQSLHKSGSPLSLNRRRICAQEPTGRQLSHLLRPRRERPRRRRAAECGQQFPPSDGDCHTPLPCEVRKRNDTTPRACCPNSAAPGAGGARRTPAGLNRSPPGPPGLLSRVVCFAPESERSNGSNWIRPSRPLVAERARSIGAHYLRAGRAR